MLSSARANYRDTLDATERAAFDETWHLDPATGLPRREAAVWRDVGQRLLFLLSVDLLPAQHGAVLKAVQDRVDLKPETAELGKKVAGWTLILALNAFAVLYVLFFALAATQQSSQRAWLSSFALLWVALDVIVVSTAMVLVKDVLRLPASVLPQLTEVKALLAGASHEHHVPVVRAERRVGEERQQPAQQ